MIDENSATSGTRPLDTFRMFSNRFQTKRAVTRTVPMNARSAALFKFMLRVGRLWEDEVIGKFRLRWNRCSILLGVSVFRNGDGAPIDFFLRRQKKPSNCSSLESYPDCV